MYKYFSECGTLLVPSISLRHYYVFCPAFHKWILDIYHKNIRSNNDWLFLDEYVYLPLFVSDYISKYLIWSPIISGCPKRFFQFQNIFFLSKTFFLDPPPPQQLTAVLGCLICPFLFGKKKYVLGILKLQVTR